MPTKADIRQPLNPPPPGQVITPPGTILPGPGAPRDVRLVRHRTMDFEVWGVVQDRPASLPFSSPRPTEPTADATPEGSRPASDPLPFQFPILGPTRQQTELYLKKKRSKRKSKHSSVLPVGGPENLAVGGRVISHAEFAVFDNKAANAVLMDAEANVRSGYPTIATSAMVARRSNGAGLEDFELFKPDIRFFSELVKPIQYRWRLRHSNGKVLLPSKHGYHPRSKSPTFKRLVEATEKLQIISEYDSGMGSIDKSEEDFETQSNPGVEKYSVPLVTIRQFKSEPISLRAESMATNSTVVEDKRTPTPKQPKPTPRMDPCPYLEIVGTSGTDKNIDKDEDDVDEPLIPRQTREFKVDFKRHDSHSELHLFLPQIHDGHYQGETPDSPNCHQDQKFYFPPISELNGNKDDDKQTLNGKKSKGKNNVIQDVRKRKKKQAPRVKSGSSEKHVPDTLNDIPTLISLENEQGHHHAHAGSVCAFDNCIYHHQKSTKLRQP